MLVVSQRYSNQLERLEALPEEILGSLQKPIENLSFQKIKTFESLRLNFISVVLLEVFLKYLAL